MATMKVALSGEGFAKQVTKWEVPDDMVKAYSTFLAAWLAKGMVEASKAVADNPEDQYGRHVLAKAE